MKNYFLIVLLSLWSAHGVAQNTIPTSRSLWFADLTKGQNKALFRDNFGLSAIAFDGIESGVLTPYAIDYTNNSTKANYAVTLPTITQLTPEEWQERVTIAMEEDPFYDDQEIEEAYGTEYTSYISYYYLRDLSLISLDITTSTSKSGTFKQVNYINFYLPAHSPDNLFGIEKYLFSVQWDVFLDYSKQ